MTETVDPRRLRYAACMWAISDDDECLTVAEINAKIITFTEDDFGHVARIAARLKELGL